jgi:two-component system, sensor histidine kinase ChiS
VKTTHCILCLLIILLLISCTNIGRYRPVANKGSLDLSEWDFNSDGTIGLNGTWEFYRDRLYTPQDFKNDSLDARPYYLNVPGVWNSLGVSGEGYGTYRLKIRLNHQYQNLGIKILDISSAYKIWINDSLVGSNGNVTASSIDFTPQMHPQVESFLVGSDQIQIVVQVANYFHHKGGIWEMIRIGTEEQIIELREKNLVFTMFFAGTVLIFFIYHIWIYLFRKNEKAALLVWVALPGCPDTYFAN